MTQLSQEQAPRQYAGPVLGPADLWRIARKRFWLILACFVVVGLGGTGALVAWRVRAPAFTVTGMIEIEPGQRPMPGEVGQEYARVVPVQLYERYVRTQINILLSDRVLGAALEALGGSQNMFVGTDAVYLLREELNVVYMINTQNISVGLTGRDKIQAKNIVQEVMAKYIEQNRTDQMQRDSDRQRDLRSEQEYLSGELDDRQRRLAVLREGADTSIIDERFSEQTARLNALSRQLIELQFELSEARAAWLLFQELQKEAEQNNDLTPLMMAFPEMMEALRRDNQILALSQYAVRLSQDLEGLKARFGPQHDAVQRVQAALQVAENDLEAERTKVLGTLVQQQGAMLRSAYDRLRKTETELLATVADARAAAIQLAQRASEYRALQEDFRRIQELLHTIMDGIEHMRISTAISRPGIRIVGAPTIPLDPSQPKLVLYIPAVIIFSLLLGFGASVGLEFIDTRLRTPAQLVRQVGVPLLGSIPDLAEDERLALDTNLALVSFRAPDSLMAEAFRQFRTSLRFVSDQPIKTLLITSPSPGDGKTTAASNLAITMARSGSRVLLVEANFRRPALARLFDLPDAVGLSNVLVGLNSPSEAIQATAVENLDIVVAGGPPPSPADLLGSESMRRFIQEEARQYDHIILDGAPVLVVADNHMLAEMVDGLVMVFRAGENTRGLAQRGARQVREMRAKLLGAVLNGVRATKGGYFREAYQAYYDYAGEMRSAAVLSRTSAAAPAQAEPEPEAESEPTPPEPSDDGADR